MSLLVWALGGCGGEEPEETAAACAAAPITTYANFGAGFLTESCQVCHASTAPDRHGAPESVTFDTEEEAWEHADRILAVATGEAPTMPPEGGVTDEDRERLEVWLRCGG